jgi:hypothetical protein
MEKNEKPIAYYDSTLSMDGSNIFLLTNKRVGHFKTNYDKYILLDNIKNIGHTESLLEDRIIVVGKSGDKLIISIETDGELFLKELQEQLEKKRPR